MQIFYSYQGRRHGPVALDEIVRLAQVGSLGPDTLYWREGMASWAALGQLLPSLSARQTPKIQGSADGAPLGPTQDPYQTPSQQSQAPGPATGIAPHKTQKDPFVLSRRRLPEPVLPTEQLLPASQPSSPNLIDFFNAPEVSPRHSESPSSASQPKFEPTPELLPQAINAPEPTSRPQQERSGKPAGLHRILAKLIDLALLSPIPLGVYVLFLTTAKPDVGHVHLVSMLSAILTACVAYLFYETTLLRQMGTTVGKRFFGLRVADPRGGRAHRENAFQRAIASTLGGIPLGIGWLFALRDPLQQAPHDRYAGTRVVVAQGYTPSPAPIDEEALSNGLQTRLLSDSMRLH